MDVPSTKPTMIEALIVIFFYTVCGWVGHLTVKLLTLGQVDLDYGDTTDGPVAEWIGVFVLLLIALGAVAVIRHT